jgi:hypothetical protein
MLAITLTFGTLFSIMFFFVGSIIGWLLKEYSYKREIHSYLHPEMLDENGNIIPDEILAVRFENYDDTNTDEESDEECEEDS